MIDKNIVAKSRIGWYLKLLQPILNAIFIGNLGFFHASVSVPSCKNFVSSLSLTIFPSASSITLSPYFFANSLSCVTTITSLFFENSFNKSRMLFPVCSSKAPVGSSAKIMFGFLTIALAIATLCFCPPDNSVTFLVSYSDNPTRSRISRTFDSASFSPCNCSASMIFSPTLNSGIRLYS